MIKQGIVVTLLLSILSVGYSQSTMEVVVSAAPGYETNIFNAPESYINIQGDTLLADQLIENAAFVSTEGALNFGWTIGAHQIGWNSKLDLMRYQGLSQANASEYQSRIEYDHKPEKSAYEKGVYLRIRSQNRLGINVLGDELLTPFTFRQLEAGSYLKRKYKGGHSTELRAVYSYKDYDPCVRCGLLGEDLSLTKREWEFIASQVFITGKNAGINQSLALELQWRDRQYFEVTNYDLLLPDPDPLTESPFYAYDPDMTYPLRHWRYLTLKAYYEFPLSKVAKVKPIIEYTRRYDISRGDFGFTQWQPSLLFYIKNKAWDLRAYLSYTIRDYTDRLARQSEGLPFPKLEYRYLRMKLRAARSIKGGFEAFTELGRTHRESNTSLIQTRVRRPYVNNYAMIGLRFRLKRNRELSERMQKLKFSS